MYIVALFHNKSPKIRFGLLDVNVATLELRVSVSLRVSDQKKRCWSGLFSGDADLMRSEYPQKIVLSFQII